MTDVFASADPGSPGAPTDPAAEPKEGVGTAVLEREELQSTDDGDADRFAHYVRKDKIGSGIPTKVSTPIAHSIMRAESCRSWSSRCSCLSMSV